ncbi:metallophosphatase [Wandonia haliotis]|uniref:Metallophosphatase n=1 Tax=Wandonia haliotis TaxID=574963 RepID=A0ABN1MPP1_9FLAO
MAVDRREFIRNTTVFGVGVSLAPALLASAGRSYKKLTILHTNDTHSRIDPFPANDKRYGNRGGVVRRAELIRRIRNEEEHILLVDAGDVFQGTPYFNQFKGELEMKVMQQMGYDAMTMGNHDFDIGLNGFLTAYSNNATFPVICSNYDFSDTILNDITIPHKIFKRGEVKIGVFGLGVELNGLVGKKLYENTRYLDPVSVANEKATFLRHEEKCDLVICLSHLGYAYKTYKISDTSLAEQTENIDLIIGGHTHTFLSEPTQLKNKRGESVLVNQVGFGGINLGRIDFYFGDGERKEHSKLLRIE